MLIPREIKQQLLLAVDHFPVVLLTGARQTGKTTALRSFFPNHRWVSLDLPSVAELAERDPQSFFSTHPPPVLIDEVQYSPGLFRHIKMIVDRDRHSFGRFVITGSQQFPLMKNVSESLAGRAAIFELETLSLRELMSARIITEPVPYLNRLICRGQFPELWRNPELPSHIFYSSYLVTYLERDVRQLLNVTSLRDFERFIRVLATRSGSQLNKSDIAKDVGVSVKAVGDWISVLQASGQIILLEPWFSNFGKRIVRSPKVYFRDSGLLAFLLSVEESTLEASPFKGTLWETFVFAELRKTHAYREGRARIWYYRDQQSKEVDFILETKGTLCLAEAKWTEHPDARDEKTMNEIRALLEKSGSPWKPGKQYIFCRAPLTFPLSERTLAVSPDSISTLF